MTTIAMPDWALDEYQLVRELGRGGMGTVFEAIETGLSRRVALKVLPRAAALDPRQLVRFQNEAQLAARLDHAHIVPVYTVSCQDSLHFYAMKFIDGRSLADVIHSLREIAANDTVDATPSRFSTIAKPRPARVDTISCKSSASTVGGGLSRHPISSLEFFRSVARLGIQAAEALDHAHSHGITHGDVKPANLLVDTHGHLWLGDFGLAHSVCSTDSPVPNSSGQVVGDPVPSRSDLGTESPAPVTGTPRYLSPEQIRDGRAGDCRSDIYSLGTTLFELLTLTPAFTGDDTSEILSAIALGKVPRAGDYNPAVPPDLEAVLCQAMATNPSERYATARELGEDLQRFVAGQPVRAKSTTTELRQPHGRWRGRTAALAAVIALTILVAVELIKPGPTSHPVGATATDGQAVGKNTDHDPQPTKFDVVNGAATMKYRAMPVGLVSWWTADKTAADAVGGNKATLVHGASFAPGQIGRAFRIDGTDAGVQVSDADNLKLTASMTIEVWIKAESFPTSNGHGEILFRGDDRSGLDPYSLSTEPNGTIKFQVTSLTEGVSVSAPITLGQFVHVAGTLDDSTDTMRLYLDGVLTSEVTTTVRPFRDLDPAMHPGIGIGNHGGYPGSRFADYAFHGLIDELKVYDTPLTAEEVMADFNARKGSLQLPISMGRIFSLLNFF